VTAVLATVVVTAAALLTIVNRPDMTADPLGAAVALVASGKAGAELEQQRQDVILQDAATQAFSITSKPKMSNGQSPSGSAPVLVVASGPPPDPSTAQGIAYKLLSAYGFSTDQWGCLDDLWTRESDWEYNAENASGAYGIPQALPGSKMASAGPDWQTDPTTQIKWGLGYIQELYGTPCGAWDHEVADGWY
jgi:hypothetical protein